MNVYAVEYCDMVVRVFSTKKKAADYVAKEVKRYMADFTHVDKYKEWSKEYKTNFEIYKLKVE